eukprot:TRINITY_DN6145_c0_g1_i1.p1 TRINITY_DN6145_c0_g1~~TRINITY_DN6145_c0_g1_i1.p1  ORF type:complete len:378 (+),score=91.13 TRINITY_DN6145_c0_g1_i1:1-1134(+)
MESSQAILARQTARQKRRLEIRSVCTATNDTSNPSKPSRTKREQEETVRIIAPLFNSALASTKEANPHPDFPSLNLKRELTIAYLLKGLYKLSSGYQSLDASRPWICYWITHSLTILNYKFDQQTTSDIVDFLGRCQSELGGFGGGPGQLSHLAPSYAAVNALVTLGTPEALAVVNRPKMYQFLMKMKDTEIGGFRIHEDGELDVRSTYCALSIASLLNLLTSELTEGVAEFIVKCQTYEGGLGGYPGNEAHGGYAFCGVSGLTILNKLNTLNVPRLLGWAIQRQMDFEGGFQGRSNKLVDSCYSFWQGAIFPQLDLLLRQNTGADVLVKPKIVKGGDIDSANEGGWLFDQEALQDYLLICCQDKDGGGESAYFRTD